MTSKTMSWQVSTSLPRRLLVRRRLLSLASVLVWLCSVWRCPMLTSTSSPCRRRAICCLAILSSHSPPRSLQVLLLRFASSCNPLQRSIKKNEGVLSDTSSFFFVYCPEQRGESHKVPRGITFKPFGRWTCFFTTLTSDTAVFLLAHVL